MVPPEHREHEQQGGGGGGGGATGSLAEMSAFVEKQQAFMGKQLYALLERERAQQQQMKAEVAAAQQQAKEAMEKLREELTPKELISTEQLTALQSRLEALHAEQLLTDDELFALEVRTVLRLDLVDYTILW